MHKSVRITAMNRGRRIAPLEGRRHTQVISTRKNALPRKLARTALSPPEYLSFGTEGIWPPVSEPASAATQYRAKVLQERQRLYRAAIMYSAALAVTIGFAAASLHFFQ